MRKTFIAILLLLLASGAAFAQYIVNFEGAGETKTAYASGTVNLTGLDWNMTESLIGNASNEFYNGTKSARFSGKANSSMTMLADKANGLGTLSFQYRRYGTDAQVAWKAEYSTNQGSSWTQAGSSFTATETVQTFSTELNVTGNVRIRILLVDNTGTTNRRMNIDDITLTDYTGGAPTPIISISGSLSPFSAWTGTPSAAQSYTLSGSNLTGNINVVAPDGFVLSTDQSTWTGSLSLASTFNGLVYVRLTGTTAGSFSGNITHNSTGAAEVTLAASGTVTDPTPAIVLTGNLNAFSAVTGSPSASQSYTVEGQFLTDPILVTPPAGYELSTDNSTWSSTLNLANNYNGLVYVRLTGTTAGTYDGNIIHSSLLVLQEKAVTGTVTDPAGPTTFLEENFEYTAGTPLTDNGWNITGTPATPAVSVSEGNLAYAGYPMSAGNQVALAASGQDVNRTFDAQISGSVYSAFLINVASAQTGGDYFYHFGPNPMSTSLFRGRVFIQKDSATNNFRIGLSNAGSISTAVSTGYDYVYDTTYLLVLKYDIIEGTNNDLVHLWVNPVISATEPSPILTSTDAITTEPAGIGSVALRQGGSSNAAAVKVDGIRVTNDWALLWSGEAPEDPVLYVSTNELDPLVAIENTPSDEIRSYTLYGTDLQGSITVTAPNGFQVSDDEAEGWDTQIQVPSSFNGLIYVRMLASISGEYSGNITNASPNATTLNVAVSGEAIVAPTTWNITANLTPFSSEAGTPSAAQSYTLSATDATANLELTVDAPFEISTSETEGYSSSLSLAPTFNGTIWVRMNPVTAGDFSGNITHTTTNASPYELAVSGTATLAPGNYATDLFFSEYLEGSSNNKALEIFNGTGVPVDLGNYKVYLYSNGASTPSATNLLIFVSGTMLQHGDVYVIANPTANASIQAQADITSTVTYFSGDDAVALVKVVEEQDVFVDIFGRIGEDPGSAWTADGGYSTVEKTLVRKPTIVQGISVNPTAGFPTLATEWDVYPQDTTTYLGSHTFAPGMEIAATPVITPASGLYYNPVEVNITAPTPGSVIRYTTDGSEPDETSSQYTAPFQVTATSTVKARAYAIGFAPSAVAIANYSFPVAVANIAALRAMPTGSTVYQLTGEAILTFQQSTRNQKYIQDATAAILIDDASGVITTAYNLYDGITGIAGRLNIYNGMLQFLPVANPAAATSTGNVIVPELRTLVSLTTADQGKLVKIENVMVDTTTVNFGLGAENINVTDPTATLVMRTFPATDYSSTAIPTVAQDIICLVGQYNATMQISPRFLADFSNHPAGQLDTPVVTISVTGNTISLNWPLVDGASTYLVEGASDPYGTYTTIETVNTNTWSGAAEGMKFFKVTAQP